MIERAEKKASILPATATRIPSSTDLDTVLPKWVYEGGEED
jgi:hypothetical protein